MQYELQKLERMTLDEVREIAVRMGLSPRRSQSIREISYAILDAQADKRAAQTQAKEDARIAAGLPTKRERARGVRRAATKVNTANLKSEQVVATVGTEKEQMAEMQEQLKANNHKPNKTVISVKGGLMTAELQEEQKTTGRSEAYKTVEDLQESQEVKVESQEVKVESQESQEVKVEKKKRGRKKKAESQEAESQEVKVESQEAESGKEKEATPQALPEEKGEESPESQEAEFKMPSLGENVIAMGTLECAQDGYGFLRSADYNYLSSPDDIYVSKDQVRQYGLKPGDTIECSIRVNPQPDKFFPMDKVIRINGLAPELAKQRTAFENLTPLFPDQKFKLCTGKNDPLSVRIIDLSHLSVKDSAD